MSKPKKNLEKARQIKGLGNSGLKNNSLKHHGTIHFEGLGANFSSMLIPINGEEVSTLSRATYTIEEVEELLLSYHAKFQNYFNAIIDEVIPSDYLESYVPFTTYINTLLEMKNAQTNNI